MGIHHLPSGLMIDFKIENGRVIYTSTLEACKTMASAIIRVTHKPANLNELK
jgi:hypothetical protein